MSHANGEPATTANARVHRTLPRHGPPCSHQSQGPVEACIQVYRGIFVASKLALEAGIGCRLLLKHLAIVWLVRHVAWLMTRYNTGRDGCSPFRRIVGKPHDGSTCKFGEQVHYKLSGRPSSRVEPRSELGAWVGKMELTDEHLLRSLAGIRSSRTINRLTKSHCFNTRRFGSHRGDSDKTQARRCGQESTGQETVHHAQMGRRAWCHSSLPSL